MDAQKKEPLYQVWAEDTKTGKLVAAPMFPRAVKELVEEWGNIMREQIRLGNEKRYIDPQVVLHIQNA